MYFYLYDSYLQEKKHLKFLDRIEAVLTDLGINGQIAKLSLLKNAEELIKDAIRRGIKTIVLVGDDQTISQSLNALVNQNIVVGFIPIAGESQIISQLFGIPQEPENACELLSKRVKAKVDVGKVNANYFLGSLEVLNSEIVLESDLGFKLIPEKNTQVFICNLNLAGVQGLKSHFFNPCDSKLEAVISPCRGSSFFNKFFKASNGESKDLTVLPFRKIKLLSANKGQEVKVKLDFAKILKTPLDIEIAEKALEIVVGKERRF